MAIVFDPPAMYDAKYGRTCHLISDQAGAKGSAELAEFARRIGMPARWLQKAGCPDEHYDLFEGRVAKAIAAGAIRVSRFRIREILESKRRVASAKEMDERNE